MKNDRESLNLAAAVLCCFGSMAAVVAAYVTGNRRDPDVRAALLSGIFGTIGSAAWAAAAYQDKIDADKIDADKIAADNRA